MNAVCTIHKTQLYPSKFQEGKFYHFTDEVNADGKKVVCYGEGVGAAVRNGRADSNTGQPIAQPATQAPDTMLLCNAANNATNLMAATGAFSFEDWDKTFEHIYKALMNKKAGI